MSPSKKFHCIVDDTALITNISEIEAWVLSGAIALVIPLHTLERLHLLKKDTSQIGQNARKAVKFLDEATSNPDVKVLIQEPDDQYQTWAQVEAHYTEAKTADANQKENVEAIGVVQESNLTSKPGQKTNPKKESKKGTISDPVSRIALEKLDIAKEASTSPMSTPPLSPSSSDPQSAKTSPEVKTATMLSHDISPVPPTLKSLINPVVWYTHEKASDLKNIILLTNSSDIAYLSRDFGVTSKNIHQLRAAISVEEQEAKNHDKYLKKRASASISKAQSEPRTLFRYEDEESEDEEVVFKPRNRGSSKTTPNIRGGGTGSVRSRGHGHSPANSLSGPPQALPTLSKPQIPTEEIDPDSFDRGSFGRGSTSLVSVGNHANGNSNSPARGSNQRGNHANGGPSRGSYHRGASRGFERGSARGRGRLFVP